MFCQVFAAYCKAAESAMHIQQEMLRQWVNLWSIATAAAVGRGRTEQVQALQKRRLENSTEVMNNHREALDTQYRSGIRTIEDASRIIEAETPDEYLKRIEDLRRRSANSLRNSAESQLRDAQAVIEKWLKMMLKEGEEAIILHRAYLKWLGEGCPDGQDRRHYFEAAQEVRA